MIAVDASVAAKWILNEEHSDRASALYATAARDGEPLVAPPLLPIEVTNILRQRMRRGDFALEQARLLLDRFLALPLTLTAPSGLYHQALAIADTYQLPAAYDAHYVALAAQLGCDLWTNDQRLLRGLGGRVPFVKWIGDYPTP